jgi:hypothetical protein
MCAMNQEAPDFYGTAEVAEALGIEKPRISRYRRLGVVLTSGERIDFPEPVLVLQATPLWRGEEIRALAAQLQRHS